MRSTNATALEALQTVELLRGLPVRKLERLAQLADDIDVVSGEVLIREGHLNRHSYLVVEGTLVVSVLGTPVATVAAGSIVGERSALTREMANATVEVAEDTRVLVIDHRMLLGAAHQMPLLKARLLELVANRDEQLADAA